MFEEANTHRAGLSIKLLAGLTFLATLSAQTAVDAPGPADEIVVEGVREPSEKVRERAVAYVQATGVANGQRPAARWIDPVCPKALGLAKPHAEIVESRIRSVADSVRISTAKLPAKQISSSASCRMLQQ